MLPTLHSERLDLRPFGPGDVDAVLDMYARWELVRFLGRTPAVLTDRSQAEARVAAWTAFDGPLHGVWAIVRSGESKPIGTALMKPLPLSGSGEASADTEVGWHLHTDAWGNGYASEAGQRLLDHAWKHGLTTVYAVTYPENLASQAVCRRLGMAHLGRTDRYYDVACELFRADRPSRRLG